MLTLKQAIAICHMVHNLSDCYDELRKQQSSKAKDTADLIADGATLIANIQDDIPVSSEQAEEYLAKGKAIFDIVYPPSL
jgi:hypothetical protein